MKTRFPVLLRISECLREKEIATLEKASTMPEIFRCWGNRDDLHGKYHDLEWGTPIHDDRLLYEFLVLEGFQAGLTWDLVLRRRDQIRSAFDGLIPARVASYTEYDVDRILASPGMIKNKRKVEAAVKNAKMLLKVSSEFGSFDAYIWGFVGRKTVDHALKNFKEMPASTEQSKAMSTDLKKRGFMFVGPTICYAFMQAVGMVNDHLIHCFRYKELKKMAKT
jgi:DNA-3-methyladenine glycosylase I